MLRDYQQACVSDIRYAFAGGARAVLLQLATGAGKTWIFSHVAAGAQRKGNRVLVVAHRRELIRQASDKLAAAGVEHGIIAPWARQTDSPAQVASVQTIARRQIEAPDLIVVDESHHSTAASYRQLRERWPGAKVLGVTATPARLDGRGLGEIFDVLVCGPQPRELIAAGWLSDVRVFGVAPDARPDLCGVRKHLGDYEQAALAAAMMRREITGSAVAHYDRLTPGQPTIVFCVSVAHAEAVAMEFGAAGWRAAAVSGETHPVTRAAAIAGLGDGSTQVLCNCQLVDEGLDIPAVGAVILLAPTLSLSRYLQRVGRGMRPAAGKDALIVLDHAGDALRHGLPSADREWTLDGRPSRGVAPVAIKHCQRCWCCYAPAPKCPECGFVEPAPRKRRVIVQRDGELVELSDAEVERIRSAPLQSLTRGADEARLREIAKVRGYHPAWVDRQMSFRCGGYRAKRIAEAQQRKQLRGLV